MAGQKPSRSSGDSSSGGFEATGLTATRNSRGSTTDVHLTGFARRAQLWKPSTTSNKPTTSSASCRASLNGSILPASLSRGGSSLGITTLRSESRAEPCSTVKLNTAGHCMPHPAKNGAGEDAHFFSSHAVGVADGVGGWAAHGIDAGEYARQLMQNTSESVEAGATDPVDAMWHGYNAVHTLGSSTCLVMILDPVSAIMQSANLGDSGYRHVRDSSVLSRAKVGQHYFNCPFQLGSHSGDDPGDSLRQSIKVLPGDHLVCGSDGLFDNLFDHEIVRALEQHPTDCAAAARAVCKLAQEAAINAHRQGPFAQEANANGISFQGGKLDDITCTVSVVVAADVEA